MLRFVWAMAVTFAWLLACAAPSVPPDSSASTPSASQSQSTPTPRRVAIVPPTRTPTPTRAPTPTVPAFYSGFAQIEVTDNFFAPYLITVTVGTVVQWKHLGHVMHDVTGDVTGTDNRWGLGYLLAGGQYDYQFNRAGFYPYFCIIHRSVMQGTVVVIVR